jgi:hypothetical protein
LNAKEKISFVFFCAGHLRPALQEYREYFELGLKSITNPDDFHLTIVEILVS